MVGTIFITILVVGILLITRIMYKTENLYCLILAGGKGRRLWPESRPELPKQFVDLFGTGRTQLQQTWDRFRKILPASHILISTSTIYRDIVKEQIPDVHDSNILAEPIWRNTAPSIVWGAHRVNIYNRDACLIVAPSDHMVLGDEKFEKDVMKGYEFVSHNDYILVLGVKPTRPEPEYGYIQMDEECTERIYHARSFTEKPELEFAKMFIESGEFLWNTSIIMTKAESLLERVREEFPPVLRNINARAADFTIEDENKYMQEKFPSYPNISFEQGVLEKSKGVYVMNCKFGWTDLGTWHSIYESEHKVDGDNVVLGSEVIVEDSRDNIIKMPKGHLAVINGLEGFIVVEKDNVLLICPQKDSSALIRKYATQVDIIKNLNLK